MPYDCCCCCGCEESVCRSNQLCHLWSGRSETGGRPHGDDAQADIRGICHIRPVLTARAAVRQPPYCSPGRKRKADAAGAGGDDVSDDDNTHTRF